MIGRGKPCTGLQQGYSGTITRPPSKLRSPLGKGRYVFSRNYGKSRGACTRPIDGSGSVHTGGRGPVQGRAIPRIPGMCTRWHACTLGFQVQDRHPKSIPSLNADICAIDDARVRSGIHICFSNIVYDISWLHRLQRARKYTGIKCNINAAILIPLENEFL